MISVEAVAWALLVSAVAYLLGEVAIRTRLKIKNHKKLKQSVKIYAKIMSEKVH